MSAGEYTVTRKGRTARITGRRIALAVLALCAMLVAGPRQATATSLVPFHATITETYVVNTPPCQSSAPVTICSMGTGQATHLGEIREVAVVESSPGACHVAERRTTTLTAVNGDQIVLDATGQNCRTESTASDAYTVTGGTGRYRGATGQGTINVTFSPAIRAAVVTIDGTLSSPGSLP